jgi:hypothetical protein
VDGSLVDGGSVTVDASADGITVEVGRYAAAA